MMEINWFAVLLAMLAYYGLGMLCLSSFFFGKVWGWGRAPEIIKYGTLFYVGLLAESIAITAGTAVIVLTLAYVPLGEALLATGILGFCYTVVTLFIHAVNTLTSRSILQGVVMSGYRLLGILLITIILYQRS
jgi:predicted anti-sigma-YlaC factor YlaD